MKKKSMKLEKDEKSLKKVKGHLKGDMKMFTKEKKEDAKLLKKLKSYSKYEK